MKVHEDLIYTDEAPPELWIVIDPCDGPHIFKSEKEAKKVMRQWAKEAKNNSADSYWDMSGPFRYSFFGSNIEQLQAKIAEQDELLEEARRLLVNLRPTLAKKIHLDEQVGEALDKLHRAKGKK